MKKKLTKRRTSGNGVTSVSEMNSKIFSIVHSLCLSTLATTFLSAASNSSSTKREACQTRYLKEIEIADCPIFYFLKNI